MKVLLLDADGVVLKKDEYFSNVLSREHNVPIADVLEFFQGPFGDCQAGVKDLKEELMPYLEKWGWESDVDAFLEYWFQDVVMNPDVEAILTDCRDRGVKCYMASNNEAYRARKIEEVLEGKLDGFFFSADLKVKKENSAFFTNVLGQLGMSAQEVGFVDNEEKNVEAAREVGIDARLFSNEALTELLSEHTTQEFKKELK